jgi:hypothetical protein
MVALLQQGCGTFRQPQYTSGEERAMEEGARQAEYRRSREHYYKTIGLPGDVASAKASQDARATTPARR